MIIIRQLRLICLHLVHNWLEARKQSIDTLSRLLREILILTSVRLKESGFYLGSPLMIPLKGILDLSSNGKVRHPIKLQNERQNDCITHLAICVVLFNLLLSNTNSKNNVIWILTNLPNLRVYDLEMHRHVNLPIQVVCSIEEHWLARTVLHVALTSSDTN